jgi:hypothetical protein
METEVSLPIQVEVFWVVMPCSFVVQYHNTAVKVSKLFHYRVHKTPPLVPIQSHMHPIHTFLPYFSQIRSNITHVHISLPSGLFHSGFSTKILYAIHLFHSCCMPCPAYLILPLLIILIIFVHSKIKLLIIRYLQYIRLQIVMRCLH